MLLVGEPTYHSEAVAKEKSTSEVECTTPLATTLRVGIFGLDPNRDALKRRDDHLARHAFVIGHDSQD